MKLFLLIFGIIVGIIMPFKPISSQNSDSQNNAQVNDMFRDLFARETVQIFKDDTGLRRVLLGKGPDGFYGLKVSQPTFDVFTASNDQLIFNSDNNVFKIIQTGTIDLPAVSAAVSGSSEIESVVFDTGIPVDGNSPPILVATGSRPNSLFENDAWPLPLVATMDGPTFGGYVGHMVYAEVNATMLGTNYAIYTSVTNYRDIALPALRIRYYLTQEAAN